MIGVLRRLAEVSALQPGVSGVPAEHLTRRAYPLAQELYPELMTKRVNSMSLSRLWIPLLDRKYGWIALVIIAINILLVMFFWRVANLGFGECRARQRDACSERGSGCSRSRSSAIGPGSSCSGRRFSTMIFWFFHGFRGWFGDRKKELIRRKQLTRSLSLQDGTGPDGIERYIHDDEAYAARVAAFLQHHLLRCPVPLYDDHGQYRFRCAGKAPVLAQAMVRAVSRARDNELFVVMADLAELGHDLTPVVKACRVARARHHHVLVIVPWPADVPSPDDPEEATPEITVEDEPAPRNAWDVPKRKPRTSKEKRAELEAKARQGKLVRRGPAKPDEAVSRVVPRAAPTTRPRRSDCHAVQRRRPGADRPRSPRPSPRNEEPPMSSDPRDDADEVAEPLPFDRADGTAELDMRETFQVLFRDPAVRNFVFVALGALGMIFLILLQQASDVGGLLIVVVGVCGLLLRWRASPAFVLLILTYFMIFPFGIPGEAFENRFEIEEARFRVTDVMLVLSVLVYLVCQYRVFGFVSQAVAYEGAIRRKDETPARRPPALIRPPELGILLGACVAFVILGQLIWWFANAVEVVPTEDFPLQWAESGHTVPGVFK